MVFACGDKSGAAELGDRQLDGEVAGLVLEGNKAGWGREVAGERERCGRLPLPGTKSDPG